MLDFILNHYNDLLAIIGGVVSVATIIVKLTPTNKDDVFLKKLVDFLEKFSIVNKKENIKKNEKKIK